MKCSARWAENAKRIPPRRPAAFDPVRYRTSKYAQIPLAANAAGPTSSCSTTAPSTSGQVSQPTGQDGASLHAPAIAAQDVVVGGRERQHLVDRVVVVVADAQLALGAEDARDLQLRGAGGVRC